MKKAIISIIICLIIIICPICLVACGSDRTNLQTDGAICPAEYNVVKDWQEVCKITNASGSRLYSSVVHLVVNKETCTYDDYQNQDTERKINNSGEFEQHYSTTLRNNELDFYIEADKEYYLQKAQNYINQVYYYYDSEMGYKKITITGFYSEIINVKLYVDHYMEIMKVYDNFTGNVTESQHGADSVGRFLDGAYTIYYFN